MNNKIKAVIIDDGVCTEICPISESYVVLNNGTIDFDVGVQNNQNSHATTCMQIIYKYTKSIDLLWYSIRILNAKTGRGDVSLFLNALNFCLELGVRVVHLSLGSCSFLDFKPITETVNKLYRAGVILVCSCSNRDVVTYPAYLPNVLGVEADLALKDDQYIVNQNPYNGADFKASARHIIECVKERRITPVSNSYATPVITSNVIRLLYMDNSLDFNKIYNNLSKGHGGRCSVNEGRIIKLPPRRKSQQIPVVVFSGFLLDQLTKLFDALVDKFTYDSYYCVKALDIPHASLYGCQYYSEPTRDFTNAVSGFFQCSLLIVGLTKIPSSYDGFDIIVKRGDYSLSIDKIYDDLLRELI